MAEVSGTNDRYVLQVKVLECPTCGKFDHLQIMDRLNDSVVIVDGADDIVEFANKAYESGCSHGRGD